MRVVILGARGRMGQLLHRRWQEAGVDVRGLDIQESVRGPNAPKDVQGLDISGVSGTSGTSGAPSTVPLTATDMAKACAGATVVLCCIPAAALHEALQALIPHMPPECVLADITSVKVQPLEIMQKLWHGPVVGTHPLFGPAPAPDMELPVSVSPGERATEAHCVLIEQLFEAIGCRVFRATAEQHDEAMAAIQGLNFISSLAYFATLAQREDLLPFLTPSFKRRQEAARKLLTEDAALFEGLFEANPYSHKLVRQYHNFLNIAASGDIDLLSARAAWWWDK